MLRIDNLKVSTGNPSSAKVSEGKKEILKGVDLEVKAGEVHVLMGPNGSGKSTLAQVLMGAPNYKISGGKINFSGRDISKLTTDKRAKLGMFLAFQHPVEIPGVSVMNVLRKAKQARRQSRIDAKLKPGSQSGIGSVARRKTSPIRNGEVKGFDVRAFRKELIGYASDLKLGGQFIRRSLNEGFSGGEKKRSEILQMMALKPKLVILDEIDSGLDVDGLRTVASTMNRFIRLNPKSSVLLITHYARILKYLKPNFVHVIVDGKIIKSGKMSLARKVEEKGYQTFSSL